MVDGVTVSDPCDSDSAVAAATGIRAVAAATAAQSVTCRKRIVNLL